ncbi:hypothetical protein E4U31_008049 [Claviceps sp. LM219 group G6]|nr:hypothetical protein E4U31_008049 [Claviceps sp. LM219 group G6]
MAGLVAAYGLYDSTSAYETSYHLCSVPFARYGFQLRLFSPTFGNYSDTPQ